MAQVHTRYILFFLLKFLVLAPLCLVLWLWVIPTYGWLLGNVVAWVVDNVLRFPIDSVEIVKKGFLNINTQIVFVVKELRPGIKAGEFTLNVAPFAALVFATGGLGLKRRLRVFFGGEAVLVFTHAVFLCIGLLYGSHTSFYAALSKVFITLPFLLWLVLAWDKVTGLISHPEQKERDGASREA